MNEIERDESAHDETPRKKGMDRKTVLILASFVIGFVLLIALNMK